MTLVGKREYKLGRMIMSHMVSDCLIELHSMAEELGISRKHFQRKKGKPHYDICKSNKAKAIQLGAKEVPESDIIRFLKLHHNDYTP